MKRLTIPLLTFLMIFIPVWGMAQEFPPRPVAVMPFTGEPEESVNVEFRDMVSEEIGNVPGNFLPEVQMLPPGVIAADLAPDEPPPDYTFGGQQYVLTGAAYPDVGQHSVQVWLWDVTVPTLIFTDELVCEVVEEAGEFMPDLIGWIFSHVPDPEIEELIVWDEGDEVIVWDEGGEVIAWDDEPQDPNTPSSDSGRTEQTQAPRGQRSAQPIFEDEDKWFHVGLRVGGTARWFLADNNWFYDKNQHLLFNDDWSRLGVSFEAAVLGILQALPFLAFQLELPVVTVDSVRFRTVNGNLDYNYMDFSYWSLNPTVLAKWTNKVIPNWWGIFGGAYYIWPIAGTAKDPKTDQPRGIPTNSSPFGWIVGAEFGFKLSSLFKNAPGMVYLDLRYAMDVGYMSYKSPTPPEGSVPFFRRNSVILSMRYQLGFINRDVKPTTSRR